MLNMDIIKIRYKSVNCFFVDSGKGLLAFDAGWPDTYRDYKDALKEQGHSPKNIQWLIVSHFHIDHAGLAGTLADNGVQFIVFPNQLSAIEEMESLIERKNMEYHPIDRAKIHVLEIDRSRNWLKQLGIRGEVLHTKGHGEQSITLLLDSGDAFIGDLAPEEMTLDEDGNTKESWELIRRKGGRYIHPAHAQEFELV